MSNAGAVKAANATFYEHSLLAWVPVTIQSPAAIWVSRPAQVNSSQWRCSSKDSGMERMWYRGEKIKPSDFMSVFDCDQQPADDCPSSGCIGEGQDSCCGAFHGHFFLPTDTRSHRCQALQGATPSLDYSTWLHRWFHPYQPYVFLLLASYHTCSLQRGYVSSFP